MSTPSDHPLERTRLESANLSEAWEEHAAEFIAWARTLGHDSYWLFHRDQFLELLPPPGRRTLDLGCGEGRSARDLRGLGHEVTAVDLAPTMVAAAREADPDLDVLHADAVSLPLEDGAFDLVVAFMSLQDMDDLDGAIAEAARVLELGGASAWRSCIPSRPPDASTAKSRRARSSSRGRTSTAGRTPTTSCGTDSRSRS